MEDVFTRILWNAPWDQKRSSAAAVKQQFPDFQRRIGLGQDLFPEFQELMVQHGLGAVEPERINILYRVIVWLARGDLVLKHTEHIYLGEVYHYVHPTTISLESGEDNSRISKYNFDTWRWVRVEELEAKQLLWYRRVRYEDRVRLANQYRCNLRGTCELTASTGRDLEGCRATCQPVENRDLLYLVLANNPEQARQLADSEKPRIVREILDLEVDRFTAYDILEALADNDWAVLPTIPELQDYLDERYDYLDQLIRSLVAQTGLRGWIPVDWDALKEQLLNDEGLWELVRAPLDFEPDPDEDEYGQLSDYIGNFRDIPTEDYLKGLFAHIGVIEEFPLEDIWRNLNIYLQETEELDE